MLNRNVTGFELNERLKERCVEMGADIALTQFFKDGVPIMPEPFYETSIEFPTETTTNVIAAAYQMILGYKYVFDQQYFFTDPLLEQNNEKKKMRIVYAIFIEDTPFNAEINFPSKFHK